MQEILPRGAPGLLSSPAVLGELSRRLPSEFEVHSCRPDRNGLVGVSSGPPLRSLVVASGGLRKISLTGPAAVATTIALRSFASTQKLPAWSSTNPSAPSISECWIKIFSRQSVLAVNVVSQPVLLRSVPSALNCTRQIAPRAVSAINISPALLNATPFATRG